MAHNCRRTVIFFQCLGCLLGFSVILVQADGKVFMLESRNGSQGMDLATAQGACESQGARLAMPDELRRAVIECSFTACTRGWLADTNLGTTVCNKLDGAQQNMKAVDVKIESATDTSSQHDSFCIKDKDKPCGDPPSFPHTTLQGHTGFEMGDELLYVCAQGYLMANGENAFTLLCDSCGEWYGLVQSCTKDETEAHIDYEDKFPDERSMMFEDANEDEDKEFAFSEHEDTEQERGDVKEGEVVEEGEEVVEDEVEDFTEQENLEPTTPTESPVSLLSQKHLFWFPSETFHETEQPEEPQEPSSEGTKTEFSEGDNHIGVKSSGSETGGGKTFDNEDNEDFPIDVPLEPHNETKTTKESVASTDESWLDGYPVTLEDEEGEKVDGSMETEEGEVMITTDQPNHVEISRPDTPSTTPTTDFTQIVAGPTRQLDYGDKPVPVEMTPTSAPENMSASKGVDDMYRTTTPSEVVVADTTTTAETVEHQESPAVPTDTWETTERVYPFINHIPVPTYAEDTTTSYQEPIETTTRSPDEFAGTAVYNEFTEEGNLTDGTGAKLLPTAETCVGEDCPQPSKGPMIAIILIVICLLIFAAVLAIWCYKKKQQKNSVYKMNGKGQTRHPQQIEMQQKV
ncbi:sushi domain-containing protein 5-like [Acipenser oxyrinchus oxyrinchus]|uniref:Sushi domain-containing protein 5-like n=1 Tax=Acipenser oxyrinchus oxyrinchus TaxID=40147 RepID=A0AAD8GDB0_ACIOX|nr:sushi domain-containing protein 5-like [Acipenser oxyrinchus oxyrinchus]